jgi:methionine biosynthesis protein MetW
MRDFVRRCMPAAWYEWLAGRYQTLRRLFVYPPGADLQRSNYDEYWREKSAKTPDRMSEWRRRRARVLTTIIGDGDHILDLGTGDGAILKYLIASRRIEAQGLDISPAAVRFCRSQGLDVDVGDLANPRQAIPEGCWDYIVMTETLEHLANPEAVLDAVRLRARKGVIVSVPNTGYITHRIRLALGRFPLQWIVCPGEHLRFWTAADFEWWTRNLGFTIVQRHPYEGVRGLMGWWPSMFAAGIVYVLQNAKVEAPRP